MCGTGCPHHVNNDEAYHAAVACDKICSLRDLMWTLMLCTTTTLTGFAMTTRRGMHTL